MKKAAVGRERMSVDVRPEEHRRIKAHAALNGESIREYVLESVRERLRQEEEKAALADLAGDLGRDPILKELWENPRDAAYDRL